jgi:glycosyltransferase involved in cell wall biosynthesis
MSAPLKVLALTRTSRRGPSTRYRIEQYRAELAARGVELDCRPLFGDAWFAILETGPAPLRAVLKAGYSITRLAARIAQSRLAARGGHDLVLIEQQLFPYLPWALERRLWPSRTPVLLEFDDAIWLTPGHAEKLAAECARADMVLVGNAYLREWAARHARRTALIPTTIDMARYPDVPPPPAAGRPLRVGWIGLRYNLRYLALLERPLQRLATSGQAVELRVISSAAPAHAIGPGVSIVHRPWSEAGEIAELQACDVGVMPLPDDAWARGKCGLKLLQFMAAGRPVIASPVGVNATIVQNGENGLLAADEEGWFAALRSLTDPDLRRRMGAAGRSAVARDYSVSGWASHLAETYRLAASR